jgi:hypothetical protein
VQKPNRKSGLLCIHNEQAECFAQILGEFRPMTAWFIAPLALIFAIATLALPPNIQAEKEKSEQSDQSQQKGKSEQTDQSQQKAKSGQADESSSAALKGRRHHRPERAQ